MLWVLAVVSCHLKAKFFAPFDAKVEVLFETKHAIGLTGTDGESILIHIGIDTLNGKPFHNLVNQGDTVKKEIYY